MNKNANFDGDDIPDVSLESRASDEIVKRIRKLRWMGLEDETARLTQLLAQMPHSLTVLGTPLDTD
jgi:hypothetical protein